MSALIFALLGLLAGVVALVALPIVALVRANDAHRRLKAIERRIDWLSASLATSLQNGPPGDAVASWLPVSPPKPSPEGPSVEPLQVGHEEAARITPGQPPAPSSADIAPPSRSAAVHPSLEERIGGHWLLYAGVGAIFLATAYFVKYAFDNAWVTPALRVTIGAVTGLTLAGAGRHFARRGYALYGQMLAGGGAAILYLSIYAALQFYALIGPGAAFTSMLAVTGMAAWLAATQSAPGLALVAVVGGYLTPFLVGTGRDAQVFLFTYVALLVGGTMYLARRRQWPVLNVVSFVLTGVVVAWWMARFYGADDWLTTEAFLTLYCVMFIYVMLQTASMPGTAARLATPVLAAGPVAYHAVSLLILRPHAVATLVYLLLVTSVGIVAAHRWQAPWLRAVVWLGAAAPFLGWVARHQGAQWLVPGLATLLGLYGLHLLATLREVSEPRKSLRPVEIALIHLNGAWACIGLLTLLAPHQAAWQGRAAFLLALVHAGIAITLIRSTREAALHFLALAFALLTVAVSIEFEGAWLVAAWAAEGFALMWIGLAAGRSWMRLAGAAVFGAALVQLIEQLANPAPVHYALLANPRAGVIVFLALLLYGAAWLHRRYAVDLPDGASREVAGLVVGANLLTWLLITVEVNRAFGVLAWEASVDRGFGAMTETNLARQMTLSIAWSVFALVLIVVGFLRRYAPLRYVGIAIFGYTVAKVALVDLARLERIYRILSVFALGILLLAASYLYQRFAAIVAPAGAPASPPSPAPKPDHTVGTREP